MKNIKLVRNTLLGILCALLTLACGPEKTFDQEAISVLHKGLEDGVQHVRQKNDLFTGMLTRKAMNMEGNKNAALLLSHSERVSLITDSLYHQIELLKSTLKKQDSQTTSAPALRETFHELYTQIAYVRGTLVHASNLEGHKDSVFIAQVHKEILLNQESAWAHLEEQLFRASTHPISIALLTKIQQDLVLSESYVQEVLLSQLSPSYLRIESRVATSVPNDYVLALGDTFQSNVYLSLNEIEPAKIWIDNRLIESTMGKGVFTTVPKEKGMYRHKLRMEYMNPKTGLIRDYRSEIRYFVH